MKQKIWSIISIAITLIVILLGMSLYKLNPRRYLGENASFIYANEGISEKKYEDLDPLLKELGMKITQKDIKKIKREIGNIYVVTYDSLLKKNKEFSCIVDLKHWYYEFLLDYEEYFNKEDDYYVLNDESLKILKDKGFDFEKVYMIPHRGNFLLSTNKKIIVSQIENSNNNNGVVDKILDKGKKENLGIFSLNLKKGYVYNYKDVYMTLNYNKNQMNPKIYIDWSQKKNGINVKNQDRKLSSYIKENRIYMYNDDFFNLFSTAISVLQIESQYMFLLNFLKINAGIEIPKLLEDIDKEIVYDIDSEQGIVKLKNDKNVRRLIRNLENSSIKIKSSLKVEDNNLYIGEEKLSEMPQEPLKLKNNQSFYLNYKNQDRNVLVESFMEDTGIKIDLKINNEMLVELIKKFNKNGGKND